MKHVRCVAGITAGASEYLAADICLKYIKEAVQIPCETEKLDEAQEKLEEKLSHLTLLNSSYREEYCLWVNSEDVVVGTWRPNVTYLPAEENMTWKFTGTFA